MTNNLEINKIYFTHYLTLIPKFFSTFHHCTFSLSSDILVKTSFILVKISSILVKISSAFRYKTSRPEPLLGRFLVARSSRLGARGSELEKLLKFQEFEVFWWSF